MLLSSQAIMHMCEKTVSIFVHQVVIYNFNKPAVFSTRFEIRVVFTT